ncbi:MAG: hypothetical protein JNL67_14945 [Planctomycetaceae bacterium]|nr:hypothetical protein [Planctomycetaceae bacterium]
MMVRVVALWFVIVFSVCTPTRLVLAEHPASNDFTVVVCNVENLFDADGVSLFDDYKPEVYRPAHLLTKLQNHAEILAKVNEGRGPDIILFQELEADQTPGSREFDFEAFSKKYSDTTLESMLTGELSAEVKDLPAAAFLLKSLQDRGLGKYHVALAEYRQDPTGRVVAHINATFSRFPIQQASTHHTAGARGILEVQHEVGGAKLYTFNNHWKSGASDAESERIREGNAGELRRQLDRVLASDPTADVVIGGDFNSQYNQSDSYPDMRRTAIENVLGSQGHEEKIRSVDGLVYNLWYELPESQRFSDVFQDRWGTLMQMMLTRGVYDNQGIQYIDNSFEVLIHEGVNAQAGTKLPIRWNSMGDRGAGFSDHFPISARFRHVGTNSKSDWLALLNPSQGERVATPVRAVDFAAVHSAQVTELRELLSDNEISDPKNLGHVFLVEGKISGERPLRIQVFEKEYNIWAFDVELRKKIYERLKVGDRVRFFGEVSTHEGQWQFVVRDLSWLDNS